MKLSKEIEKRIFAVFVVLVIVLSNLSVVKSLEASDIANVEVNIDKADPQDFEDIAIFVDSYAPTVVKSWFLEKKDYPVYVSLSGISINPTLDITKIRNIRITPSDASSRKLIGSVTPIAPPNRRYTLSNLGGAIISLKRIPREDRVPGRIDVNLTAYIDVDVAEGFGAFETDLVLGQEDEDKWFGSSEKEASSFWGGSGYVRVNKIGDDNAEIVVYDDVYRDVTRESLDEGDINLRSRKRTLRLSVGETSGIISLRRDIFAIGDSEINQRLSFRDKVRLRLNEIRNAGKSAELSVIIDGIPTIKKVYEGSPLYEGSSWTVKSIIKQNTKEIVEITDGKNTKIIVREPIISGTAAQVGTQDKIITSVDLGQQKINELSSLLDDAIAQNKIEDINSIRVELIKLYDQYYGLSSGRVARQKLSQISEHYLSGGTKYDRELNELYRDIAFIDNQKALQKQTQTPLSTTAGSQDYYKRAIDDFEVVADSYPSSSYAPKALFEAARTRVLMGDYDGAIVYYNRYLSEFSGEASVEANRKLVEFLISSLQNDKNYLHEDALGLLDNAKKLDVRISGEGVKVIQDSSKATISVSDNTKGPSQLQQSIVSVGQEIFGDEDSTAPKWYVQQIDSDKIIISRVIDSSKQPETRTIRLNQDAVIVQTQNGARSLRVDRIDFSSTKEVHITVLPGEERFVSKSDFSAHFFIEKRLFELTPKQIDAHIKTTKNLIAKFDSAIDSLDKVHKVWTTWCYGVFATLWVKNLITSFGGRSLARKVVMDKWNKICNQEIPPEGSATLYQPQDNRLKGDAIFDDCIRFNSGIIQDEINKANDAVSKTDEQIKQIKESGDQRFSGLDIQKDEGLIRQTLLKENLAKELKTQQYVDEYISSQIELQKAIITSKYDIDKHPENLNTVLTTIGFSEQDYNNKNQAEKQEILSRAIRDTVEHEKNQYILGLPNNLNTLSISDSVPSEMMFSSVNKFVSNTFSPGEVKGAGEKIAVYKGEIQEYPQEGKQPIRVVIIDGDTKLLVKERDATGKETGREYYIDGGGSPVYIEPTQNLDIRVDDKKGVYKPIINTEQSGKSQGLVKRITIDEIEYAEVKRTDSGAIEKVSLWKRLQPNSDLGSSTDIPEDIDITPKAFASKGAKYSRALTHIRTIDAQVASGRKIDTGFYASADAATKYVVGKQVAKVTGPKCSDFMDATDCLFLFGACDPIMCPTSRFNRGGNYYVNNVVATGIFGSIFLGADTLFDPAHGEVLPVCLTGITAGAKNYRSILQGYVQCLEVKRDKGLSVGICDRIRNVGICSVVWREAAAILNVDGGGLGILSNKLLDKGKGGGEYAFFKQGIKNSVEGAKFFTNQYASNVFAAYRGDTIGEVGGELCQAAIYGRIPGGGSIIERLSRPSGPAQFTAILDEVPRSTIARGDVVTPRDSVSDYQVYYHIYAGDQSDIVRYLVEVRGPGLPPRQLSGLRLLRAGEFVDQNEVFSSYSGYSEVCIQVNGNTQCGFGVVSTDYEISKLREDYVKNQAQRTDITTEKQCVPEPGLIASASGPLSGALGVLSSGLTQTSIIRKCSGENPGLSDHTDAFWVEVGTCGKDDIGRSLGGCFLDTRSTDNLLKDKQSQQELDDFLEQEKLKRIATGELLSAEALNNLLDVAQNLRAKAKDDKEKLDSTIQSLNNDQIKALISGAEQKYKEAITKYDEVIQKGVLEADITAQAHFERGTAYQALGLLVAKPKEKLKEIVLKAEEKNTCKKSGVDTWRCVLALKGLRYSLEGTQISIRLNSLKLHTYDDGLDSSFDVFVGDGDKPKDCKTGILWFGFGTSIDISGDARKLRQDYTNCESKDIGLLGIKVLLDLEFTGFGTSESILREDRLSFEVKYKTAEEGVVSYVGPKLGEVPTKEDVDRIRKDYGQRVEKDLLDNNFNIGAETIYGIMWVESRGYHTYPPGSKDKNDNSIVGNVVTSLTGCKGVMQICKRTAPDGDLTVSIFVDDRNNLDKNILGGIKILKKKYDYPYFVGRKDRLKFAVLSYNVGQGVVEDMVREAILATGNSDPSFEEAINYLSQEILTRYKNPNPLKDAKEYAPKVFTALDAFGVGIIATTNNKPIQQETTDSVVPPGFPGPGVPEGDI